MSKRQSSILSFLGSKEENLPTAINLCAPPSTPESAKSKSSVIKEAIPSSPLHDEKDSDERYEWLINIRDSLGRIPSDPNYDSTTLYIPQSQWKKFTPFERQFWEIKSTHYDSVVFFKKGKFYELYENDADLAASLFDLKIADRVNMKMAGVPEASFTFWASKFVNAGYKVVKVDQSENSIAKQIRKRSSSAVDEPSIISRTVTAVLSRGTLIDPSMTVDTDYSFCTFIFLNGCDVDICLADISLRVFSSVRIALTHQTISSIVMKFNPKEIVLLHEQKESLGDVVRRFSNIQLSFIKLENCSSAKDMMMSYFKDMMLDSLAMELREVDLFTESENNVNLSGQLLESLDIYSIDPKKKTIWKNLNRTVTAAGRRKLLKWLLFPSCELKIIEERQSHVSLLLKDCKLIGIIFFY